MLPFLKHKDKSASGISITHRKPDSEPEAPTGDEALEAAAQDIIRALEQKDHQHLALALRAAFQILDSEPHSEGPHIEEGME